MSFIAAKMGVIGLIEWLILLECSWEEVADTVSRPFSGCLRSIRSNSMFARKRERCRVISGEDLDLLPRCC